MARMNPARLGLLLLLCAALLPAGCFRRDTSRGGTPCFDSGDCNDATAVGEEVDIEACIDGQCEDVDCLSSADCVVGQFCDLDDQDYACVAGCQGDGDCFAGQQCDDGTCVAYGCRSTILDCDFNEVCDEDSGECRPADGLQCVQCDPSGNQRDDRGTANLCDDTLSGHTVCGQGAVCAGETGDAVCWTPCDAAGGADQCPMGFSCGTPQWTPGLGCDPVLLGPYCIPTDSCDP